MLQRTLLGTMVASIMAGLAAPIPAIGQESLEEVVVTARKRAESLREIPIAISAVTAERLERENITRLEELTMRVPGVQYHSLGLAIPGRVNSSIRFRGMDVNSQVPTFQLGTLFVDGIYVLGGTHSIPFDDVERVEVIKGPQSAYFGRNTFGGAINYITKEPRLDEFEGDVKVLGAEFDEYEISGAVSGPLLKDKLGIRVGARKYRRGGMFTASDGGELGEESTESYQVALKFQPIENLTITARYWHGQDEDGPAAGGAIPGRLNNTCTGPVTNPAGQTVTPARWFCGTVPEQGDAISPLGTRQVIDSNTLSTSARALASTGDANWLLTNFIQRAYPARIDGKVPTLEAIEMERETTRVSAKVTYEFGNGMTADLIWGDNKMAASWVRDYNFTGFDNGYSRDPQYDKDRSAEVRLTSAQDQKLRWLVGLNYYEQSFITAGGGGDAVFFCIDSVAGPTIGACRPGPAPSAFAFFPNSLNNSDHVETKAIFAAAAYDFTNWFTLSLEGRYQDDSFERGLTTITKIQDENFLPRVILQFKPREGTNLYASYAEGLIQGEINQLVVDADARERAQFDAVGTPGNVPAEILKSYEIGWKQLFLDNRLSVNTAAYYGTWSDKKIRQVVAVNFTCGDTPTTMGSVGCRPNLGEGSLGEPARNPDGSPALNNVNVVSAYDVDIWGVELEFDSVPTDRLRVGGALTWARSEVQEGIYNTIALIAGSNNIKGAANPRFPEWSGSINAEYTAPLSDSWEWFVRGDANYFGKTYVDLDNLAQCDDYTIANAGLGVSRDNVRIEVFARNLLDDDSWAACARFLEFDLPLDQAGNAGYHTVIVAPQNPRQFGLRASYRF